MDKRDSFDTYASEEISVQDLATGKFERTSEDGKRILILGHVDLNMLVEGYRKAFAAGFSDSISRPHIVHATKDDGHRRTWFVTTRDEARTLTRKYREHGATAVKHTDIRKNLKNAESE